jgi:hypothetical protein
VKGRFFRWQLEGVSAVIAYIAAHNSPGNRTFARCFEVPSALDWAKTLSRHSDEAVF